MLTIIKKNIDSICVVSIVFCIALLGNFFSRQGMPWYHNELVLPTFTPAPWVFPLVWTTLFILTALAVITLMRFYKHTPHFRMSLFLFALNASLNVAWTFLFFVKHFMWLALLDAIALGFTILCIMALTWKDARIVAWLILPYALWVGFAIIINYAICLLN